MGITIRNAERLGLHRDGTVLGLPPVEIEDRRRVWWQLQHLDLVLAVRIGLTPMTLTTSWDVQLPSNIEDNDINLASTTTPIERRGLTSMSYCRFTYWVLNQQRQNFIAKHGRFELSWQSNTALPATAKDDMILQLENGINQHFVQYCDPIKPLDVLLQLFARLFIAFMQIKVLHARMCKEGSSDTDREALLAASAQSVRYNVAIQTQPQLAPFRWLSKAWFAWQACESVLSFAGLMLTALVMCVLVEASDTNDRLKARELWDLLASVYATSTELFDLGEDRRRFHAAELVIAAWSAYRIKFTNQQLETPGFVANLEQALIVYCSTFDQTTQQQGDEPSLPSVNLEPFTLDGEFEFDIDLQDIDWSFWSSID
jgi:hypothetical protein